jgi:signal transduction histidine kinase
MDNESKIYALESGADAYLTQPVEPTVLVATVRSLVRLRRAESQSRLSARQWQATFDALSEGVALTDSAGIVERSNRALSNLLDKPYFEIEKRSLSTLLREYFRIELDCRKRSQFSGIPREERYFDIDLEPIFLEEVHTSSILIVTETTARRRAEAAILANERLAATGRMANTIAHEINNPLEAITNLLYLLKTSIDQPAVAGQYLQSAQTELERVSKIARRILSFNRESASPVSVNLSEILEDVLALNNRALVEKKIQVIREWNKILCVEGFPAQLRQVFSNIIRNAIEASFPTTAIRLRISGYPRNDSAVERVARVTISDRGVGISALNRRKVFDAFFTTKELKGSGIGLWLSDAIVREHRGYIQVRSSVRREESGTCLSVVLPCRWNASSSSS